MTSKQKKAFEKSLENGGNISKAMVEAGYSPNTAHTPQKLTETKGWSELLDELPDASLKDKLKEGLEATRASNAAILVQKDGKIVKAEEQGLIEVPDFIARHKYIETILKLKDKYPVEKKKIIGDEDEPIRHVIEIVREVPHRVE